MDVNALLEKYAEIGSYILRAYNIEPDGTLLELLRDLQEIKSTADCDYCD